MSYVKNLEVDEIRCGFLVTSDRKRLWNVQIELILELQRICEKYNLKFLTSKGTLLGAARHGGFIPWDDDVDIMMPRSDYEKFKLIAKDEIHYPFYFDLWYENEDPPGNENGYPLLPFAKLRDLRTLQIQRPNYKNLRQGIWIDIFPIDSIPNFDNSPNKNELDLKFKLVEQFLAATCLRDGRHLDIIEKIFRDSEISREEILQIPLRIRGKMLDDLLASLDQNSRYVNPLVIDTIVANVDIRQNREWFDETIYLPFEEISLPAPKHFDEILTNDYGNWRKFEILGYHSKIYSADISYDDYLSVKNSSRTRLNSDEMRNGKLVTTWRKKIWKAQLDLILELNRVCEKFNLRFWATSSTLFAAAKFHGFNPEDDFITLEMTREDFEKLEFHFPFRLVENRLMDERTMMIEDFEKLDRPNGIFIEIKIAEQIPDEIEYLPFEFTSIPVPKNYEEVLKNLFEHYPNIEIARRFPSLVVSADVSYHEFYSETERMKKCHT